MMTKSIKKAVLDELLGKVATKQWKLYLTDWERYYYDRFGKYYEFSNLPIPDGPEEYSWHVCVHPEKSAEEVLAGGKNPQPYWKCTSYLLDDILALSADRDGFRDPYIVRCRPNLEADEDLKGISANKALKQDLNCITLKERLLLGDFLYWKEGIILDRRIATFCPGSRYIDHSASSKYLYRNVATVKWSDKLGVCVGWTKPDISSNDICIRQSLSFFN